MTLPVSEGQPSFYQNVSGRIRQEQSGSIEFHDDDGGEKKHCCADGYKYYVTPIMHLTRLMTILGFDRILGPNVRQKEEARASFARQVLSPDHPHYHCHPSHLTLSTTPLQ